MKFGKILTPEEAEREWGIPQSGELVITPMSSSSSKASQSSKSQPSGNGQKTQENSPQSERSMLKVNDEMEDEDTPQDDDPNRPETEADGIRAEAIRRLKVHHLFKGRQDQTQG
jgi:hypothetical protein